MPGVLDLGACHGQLERGLAGERRVVQRHHRPPARLVTLQLAELPHAQRGLDVGHVVLEAREHHLVIPAASLVVARPRLAAHPVEAADARPGRGVGGAPRAGSRLSVSGSTSASTGRAPTCSITLADAAKVIGVVTTSSPGPICSVTSAVWSAAVQELSASAPGACTCAANSVSKRRGLGPVVIQLGRSVSTTSAISSSPVGGGE